MKKIIIATLAATAVASSAYSQGLVNFNTGATAGNRISTNSLANGAATGNTAAVANQYYFALFASANQTLINGSAASVYGTSANYVFNNLGTGVAAGGWELVGIGGNLASIGRFGPVSQGGTSANQGPINADGSLTVAGIAGGGSANFVSIGWSANIGSTLQSVEDWYNTGALTTGWIGQSAIGVGLTLGDGAAIPSQSSMGAGTGQVGGYVLGLANPVPEPGTMALAALGGASLLLFRRRK